MYELRTSFVAHKSDVVGLIVTADDSIVSCSRDKTIKIWKYNGDTKTFLEDDIIYSKNNLTCKFPTCVCILPPSDLFENDLILTGDNDNRIFVYESNNPIPVRHIRAHSNAVSKIASSTEPNVFLSASWDATVKMWLITEDSLKCLLTINSHSSSVWTVLEMKRKFILTGSADQLIRIFDVDGNLKKTLNGHKGCVRDIAEINDDEILSCSNDSTVRRWSINTGKCLEILTGHPNFVYSVRLLGSLIISCGEDKCLLLWSHGKPVQTITLPAKSIWTAGVLSNNDIVVGSSDGVIRIFTTNKNRRADKKTLLRFANECGNQEPIKVNMGRKKFSRLPGSQILSKPGNKEGQRILVRLVRESKQVNCFSWSIIEQKWKNLGLVHINFDPFNPFPTLFRRGSQNLSNGGGEELIPKEPKTRFCCAVCRRKFSKKSNLRRHIILCNHILAKKIPKFLPSVLPSTFQYQVLSFEKNGSSFRLKLCLEFMNSHNDLKAWIKRFAALNNSVYRRQIIKKYPRAGSKYSEFYRCQHWWSAKTYGRKLRSRATHCKSTVNGVFNRDSVDNSFYCIVNINFCHNHPIEDASKIKKPNPEVRNVFKQMCQDGLSPINALRSYRKQLKLQSPQMFERLCLDRSLCPDYYWVRRFFRKIEAQTNSEVEKIEGKSQELEKTVTIRAEYFEIENINIVDEFEQYVEVKTGEIDSEVNVENVNESGPHIITQVVDEFAILLAKLEEDPLYYEEGVLSMSCELRKLCQSTAELRLRALCSFNKCADKSKR